MKNLTAALLILAPIGTPALAEDLRTAVVAGGCFWCVEADFDKVEGVTKTTSGYAGGDTVDPTYKQVVAGGTGHLEVVEITYDADVLDYETLLTLFVRSIDPLDAGGQFCDRGYSYSTAIFTTSIEEAATAARVIAQAETTLGQEIVTPVLPAAPFYTAERYHQNFHTKSALRYNAYRLGCGRDARVRAVWGDEAFVDKIKALDVAS